MKQLYFKVTPKKCIPLLFIVFVLNGLNLFLFIKVLVPLDMPGITQIHVNGTTTHEKSSTNQSSISNSTKNNKIQDKFDISHLFPMNNESNSDDRIVKQLGYRIPLQNTIALQTILLYGGYNDRELSEINRGLKTCNVKQCLFTMDDAKLFSADAVMFNAATTITSLERSKRSGQVWIFYQLESPILRFIPIINNNINSINFTATYRRDSVIVTPYEKFVPYSIFGKKSKSNKIKHRNYAKGKTKMAAWFVSNCHGFNGRIDYVTELQKYISVDIYGSCGPFRCDRGNANKCYEMLNKNYKFYLAFENANCVDYITEKLYWNGLNNDIIPVVMGARPEDYDAVVPQHSIIHVDNFQSPKQLAEYLHLLNRNDTLYNRYFKWKGTGEFINTKMWCRICSLMHASDKQKIWYKSMTEWWAPEGICVTPRDNLKWSTWRGVNSNKLNIPSPNFSL